MEQLFYFSNSPQSPLKLFKKVLFGNKRLKDQVIIDYPHITKQQILKPAEAKFIKLDLKTNNQKIGYIMGAGEVEVPEYTVFG
jgi:hypothetical protein